jgi:hypothetical protein
LRAAARVVTGIPHYFSASYIDAYDAATSENSVALTRSRVLLNAVTASEMLDAKGWRALTGLPGPAFASRGIAAKNDEGEDVTCRGG